MDNAPTTHHFINHLCTPTNARTFNAAVMKDIRLLQSHLPPGIIVKAFSDRLVTFFFIVYFSLFPLTFFAMLLRLIQPRNTPLLMNAYCDGLTSIVERLLWKTQRIS